MSYEKQTWQTGDVVTSAKLNHMEDGIAGGGSGVLVEIGIVEEDRVQRLNKTGQEILNYVSAGSLPFISYEELGFMSVLVFVSMTGDDEEGYSFAFGPSTTYFCDTLSDYPAS